MQFQFDMTAQQAPPPLAPPVPESPTELLRQILDVQREYLAQIVDMQREQIAQTRALAQDATARWRHILGRSQKELPDLANQCQEAYPILEKVYLRLLAGMVEELTGQEEDGFDSDFALQEFIDRYGMRLGQMGHLVHTLGPIAEAAHQNQVAGEEKNK